MYWLRCFPSVFVHSTIPVLCKGRTVKEKENAAAELGRFSVDFFNQEIIVKHPHALPALRYLLRHGTDRGKRAAMSVLYNLSLNFGNVLMSSGVVPLLFNILIESASEWLRHDALRILDVLNVSYHESIGDMLTPRVIMALVGLLQTYMFKKSSRKILVKIMQGRTDLPSTTLTLTEIVARLRHGGRVEKLDALSQVFINNISEGDLSAVAESGVVPLLVDLICQDDIELAGHALAVLVELGDHRKGLLVISETLEEFQLLEKVLQKAPPEAKEIYTKLMLKICRNVIGERAIALPVLLQLIRHGHGAPTVKADAVSALYHNLYISRGNGDPLVKARAVQLSVDLINHDSERVNDALRVLTVLSEDGEGLAAISTPPVVMVLLELLQKASPLERNNCLALLVRIGTRNMPQFLTHARGMDTPDTLDLVRLLCSLLTSGTPRERRLAAIFVQMLHTDVMGQMGFLQTATTMVKDGTALLLKLCRLMGTKIVVKLEPRLLQLCRTLGIPWSRRTAASFPQMLHTFEPSRASHRVPLLEMLQRFSLRTLLGPLCFLFCLFGFFFYLRYKYDCGKSEPNSQGFNICGKSELNSQGFNICGG